MLSLPSTLLITSFILGFIHNYVPNTISYVYIFSWYCSSFSYLEITAGNNAYTSSLTTIYIPFMIELVGLVAVLLLYK